MGCCTDRQKIMKLPSWYTKDEQSAFKRESQIGLHFTDYTVFLAAIKRYGYMKDLNDVQFEKISPEIGVDYDKLDEASSPENLTFFHKAFMTGHRKHEVKKLLRLGWFVCQHPSKEAQAIELWYLLDPKLTGRVEK